MRNEINAVDLAFVIDTTGSMGGLIAAARQQMIAMIKELTQTAGINLWLGIVEYRDHPPQDTMLYQVYDFTANMEEAQKTITRLSVCGGGDGPEAVLDGVVAACRELSWWKHSRRLVVLIGDAPPHGVGTVGDAFATGCPCGETIESVSRLVEEQCITLHALGLTDVVKESFGELSALTGGRFFAAGRGEQAIEHIATLLKMEFADLEVDRLVLDLQREAPASTIDELAERLSLSRHVVSTSLVRLLSRDLISVPAL